MSGDRRLGVVFALLGVALAVGAWALPGGGGSGAPGPGFFPLGIGMAMAALGVAAALGAGEAALSKTGAERGDRRGASLAAAILFVYLLLWGTGGFAVRTVLFLVVVLRLWGQGWKPSLGVAAALTAAVVAAFQWGLKISLD